MKTRRVWNGILIAGGEGQWVLLKRVYMELTASSRGDAVKRVGVNGFSLLSVGFSAIFELGGGLVL